ncbi:MAG: endonuclease III [Candidatus Omnitrophica bacterium]|nr:endonuclease III [Candidatus Omnitrophota bacterium]
MTVLEFFATLLYNTFSLMDIPKRISVILSRLNKAYGKPKLFPRSDPVDEVIRTVLSQNTNDRNSLAAFAVLKKAFTSWDKTLAAPTQRIAHLIRHAGLSNIKARRIKEVLTEIKRREGRITLSGLGSLDAKEAMDYLRSLKGVGPKTAACVLLFSFRKPAMPVDTHIFRVSKRLGLISSKTDIEEAHEIFTEMFQKRLVPRRGLLRKPCSGSRPDSKIIALIYNFHLCIIEHGRKTCKAQNPRCGSCVLYSLCRFKEKFKYETKVKV